MIPSDLAPGDLRSLDLDRDWSDVELHRVGSTSDPLFDMAFGALWSEFGAIGELEEAPVLARRMLWDPAERIDGTAMRYRMMLVTSGGQFAAVRDHTAIVVDGEPGAVVHLSHNLVAPDWRRSGLAGWMRALPITTARHVLEAQGRPKDSPITLVGEMEHPDPEKPESLVRLRAYEKAGYKKVDPSRVGYLQPDFRASREIDLTGGPRPIPLSLIVRRVGREGEPSIPGSEVRQIVGALYRMYATGFRKQDMTVVHDSLLNYPDDHEDVALLPPTA
ncbi:MAG: hypothetical protein SFU53_00900 [Terrimicrobiaceae bacterium]|nr:hypothetical protein [Terrimicrobiaceae bacterium]